MSLAEAGNVPAKALWDGFPCALGQWGLGSITLGMQCPAPVLTSPPLAAPHAFRGVPALAQCQADRHISTPPSTWNNAGIQLQWCGMGWDGAGELGVALCIGAAPGRAMFPGCHSSWDCSCLPIPSRNRVGGSWRGTAQPFSDPGACVYLFLVCCLRAWNLILQRQGEGLITCRLPGSEGDSPKLPQ